MKNNIDCLIKLILIIFILFIVLSDNKNVREISNKLTTGTANTLIILAIIVLTLSENLKIGFYLTIIYLFLLIKYNVNNKENFKSESGYSPLNCKTYKDSKEKTGSAYYPLHATD